MILDFRSGSYYGLDAVGARIWDLLKVPRSIASICETIVEEYAVEPDICEKDLISFLEDLREAGLIEVKDEQAS